MRLDQANRSFLAFVGVAFLFGATVLCGAIGSVLVPLSLARMSHGGFLGLWNDRASLLAPLVLLGLILVGVGLGGRALARQTIASRVLSRRVRALTTTAPEALAQAARQTGLAGRVVLVDAGDSFSFVYGAMTPRVAVSRGLLERATDDELRAVLEHERYHVRNVDPLKAALVRVLSEALFILPALDSLRTRYMAGRELAADRRAVALCGRRPLAGALLKVVRGPDWSELEAPPRSLTRTCSTCASSSLKPVPSQSSKRSTPRTSCFRSAVPRCSSSCSSCQCPAWVERRLSTTLRGPG